MALESFGRGLWSLEASPLWVCPAAPGPPVPIRPPTCSQPSPHGAVPVPRGAVRAGRALLGRCRLWPSGQRRASHRCRQGCESQRRPRPRRTARLCEVCVTARPPQHESRLRDGAGRGSRGRHSVSCVVRGVPSSAAVTLRPRPDVGSTSVATCRPCPPPTASVPSLRPGRPCAGCRAVGPRGSWGRPSPCRGSRVTPAWSVACAHGLPDTRVVPERVTPAPCHLV